MLPFRVFGEPSGPLGMGGRKRRAAVTIYDLRDEFTTNLAAGSVNGTNAEPTGGTRTVVDTQNKLSLAGGVAVFNGGKASPAYGDPMLKYTAINRVAGKAFLAKIIMSANTTHFRAGWFAAGTNYDIDEIMHFMSTSIIGIRTATGVFVDVAPYTATTYYICCVLRATGSFWFIKGGIFNGSVRIFYLPKSLF